MSRLTAAASMAGAAAWRRSLLVALSAAVPASMVLDDRVLLNNSPTVVQPTPILLSLIPDNQVALHRPVATG